MPSITDPRQGLHYEVVRPAPDPVPHHCSLPSRWSHDVGTVIRCTDCQRTWKAHLQMSIDGPRGIQWKPERRLAQIWRKHRQSRETAGVLYKGGKAPKTLPPRPEVQKAPPAPPQSSGA